MWTKIEKYIGIKYYPLIMVALILVFGGSAFGSVLVLPIVYTYMVVVVFLLYNRYKEKKDNNYTLIISFPILLSVFQNMYLGIISTYVDGFIIQALLMMNYIYVTLWVILLLVYKWKNVLKDKPLCIIYLIFGIMIIYSLITFVLWGGTFESGVANFRNVSSCYIYMMFAYLLSDKLDMKKIMKSIMCIGSIVLSVGIYEQIVDNRLWIRLDIGYLWEKKGMSVATWGLPPNFVSSEKFFGEYVRRMVATFADPVNLGTFLAAILLISWFMKNRKMICFTLIGIFLTVSKGALLSILILVVVICIYKIKSKKVKGMIILSSFMTGVLFLIYAHLFSSGSVFLHISGFFNALVSLVKRPFGYGLGNIGVLSDVLGQSKNQTITESGFGAIVGQIGIVGLLAFGILFIYLIYKALGQQDKQQKILFLAGTLSIFSNILFNEVALSPNSCGIYFILFGLLLGKEKNLVNFE